jgi:Fe-S-cluster-containing hydrogenase component 2
VRVALEADAPPKPEWGAACNGCGLCCAVETCPLGLVLFRRRQGPCPALGWAEGRYHCGVLTEPGRYIPLLPRPWAARLVARWIAAGKGCDCRYRLDDHPA